MKAWVFHVSGMRRKIVALINSNRIHPPISPVGLEYVGEVLIRQGFNPILIDLCFEKDWKTYLRKKLSEISPDYIGITFRNLDEAMTSSKTSFLPLLKNIVSVCREASHSPIILGGAGYAIAPVEILDYTKADFGLVGNGINGIKSLLLCLENDCVEKCPGAIYKIDKRIHSNPVDISYPNENNIYGEFNFSRNFADLLRYFEEGGQIGIETKRGCSNQCAYCVESRYKSPILLRSPKSVVHEIKSLLNKGIDVFHLCDSEFNLPLNHAKAICKEIIKEGLSNKIKWYTYCTPELFDEELAQLMEKAGCQGINFCVDTIDEKMLKFLNKKHSLDSLKMLMKILRGTNIAVMFDLLLGAPNETKDSAWFTIERALELKPDVIGISLGVRLYPYTHITTQLRAQIKELTTKGKLIGHIDNNSNLLLPIFYLEPELDNDFLSQLNSLARSNPGIFLSLPPTEESSYTYCSHHELSNAIKKGARGAYWHILYKLRCSTHNTTSSTQ